MFPLFIFLNVLVLCANFDKKLIVLLMLESLFLLCTFMLFFDCGSLNYNLFLLFLLSVFMVLDSVLGVSLLVLSSRNYTSSSVSLTNF
uniref:NADH dehydrogenase subunit 4L n=1 Tax=Phyllocoptes taishanensis TaxID=1638174 RepID=A0A0U2PXI4_9ACAR|nr:NADH dehydrogenase subunit 4L [Phyllocoptes taishanensis]ALK03804.1 NADH dehydrogenase subunit 4L [Phyllocoptes taishanensis]